MLFAKISSISFELTLYQDDQVHYSGYNIQNDSVL